MMDIEFNGGKKWYKAYEKLKSDEKKYMYILETVSSDLPLEFFEEVDIISPALHTFTYLNNMKRYEEMIELYDKLCHWKEHIDEWYYIEKYPIDYYLYCNNVTEVKKHLESYLSNPVKSIDIFIPVFDKFVYYGHSDLALEVSFDMFDKVKDAPKLMQGTEDQFGQIIYMEKLQNIYGDLKKNIPVQRDAIVKYLEKYCFETESYIDLTINALSPQKDMWPDYKVYQRDVSDFFHSLKMLFCRYMLDSKNVNFAVSNDIWNVFLYSIKYIDPDEEPVENYDSVFELDAERYDVEISARMDFISNKVTCGVAAAWGMVYIYDFLHNHGYISDKVHSDALKVIDDIKYEIIDGNTNHLWEYNFVYKWGRPDSVDEDVFTGEKELFEESFGAWH